MSFARDGLGTAVEIYPADSVMRPNGEAGADFVSTGQAQSFNPVHFAISVDRDVPEIEAIARREGWDCFVCDRGGHSMSSRSGSRTAASWNYCRQHSPRGTWTSPIRSSRPTNPRI
jgi:hypothetical protein